MVDDTAAPGRHPHQPVRNTDGAATTVRLVAVAFIVLLLGVLERVLTQPWNWFP